MAGDVPSVAPDTGAFSPYGFGAGPFTTSDFVYRTDAAFAFTGDFALSGAFNYSPQAGLFQGICGAFTSTSNDWFALFITPNGSLRLQRDIAATPSFIGTAGPIASGWHSFTVRVVGTAAVVKLNGTTVLTGTIANGTPSGSGTTFSIGALDNVGTGITAPWFGSIHEVRVWGAANVPSQAVLDALTPSVVVGTELGAYFLGVSTLTSP